jgi:hypothetical protein
VALRFWRGNDKVFWEAAVIGDYERDLQCENHHVNTDIGYGNQALNIRCLRLRATQES